MEAIALYSGNKEKPIYYYAKNKLSNLKYEGIDDNNKDGDSQYVVATTINDDPINFGIDIKYGNAPLQIPFHVINTSPLHGYIIYRKEYGNFAYRIVDCRNNPNDKRSYHFSYIIKGKENGYAFEITKNGQRFAGEYVDGNIVKRNIELPQSFYNNADKIFKKIIEEGQKALNAQKIALQVKQQYKQRICSNNVKVNFLDNAEYKAICEEDRYMAEIKTKLDKELEKRDAQIAQERMARAREAEAMAAQQQAAAVSRAAQQQAAAAQQQAEAASQAVFNQSMHNMNMNSQMQQLNNNLFMMRHGF